MKILHSNQSLFLLLIYFHWVCYFLLFSFYVLTTSRYDGFASAPLFPTSSLHINLCLVRSTTRISRRSSFNHLPSPFTLLRPHHLIVPFLSTKLLTTHHKNPLLPSHSNQPTNPPPLNPTTPSSSPARHTHPAPLSHPPSPSPAV